jgi:uncharacterized protein (TIGR03437 family)
LTRTNSRYLTLICGLILASVSAWGQIMIDTFAGGHIPSGVPAQNVALGGMSGITRDPAGNLVFCDDSNNVIRRINADGTIQTIAGVGVPGYGGDGGPALSAVLNVPGHAKYDGAGNLYFVDIASSRIRRVDTSGIITTVAGTGIEGTLGADGPAAQAQIGFVTDLVIDAAGYVYFAEYGQASIRRLAPLGRIEVYATCAACATSFYTELALAMGPSGDLYVADQAHIFRIATDRVIHNFAGFGAYSTPNMGNGGLALKAPPSDFVQLAADSAGNVYTEEGTTLAGEQGTFIIRRIGTDGIINIVAGTFDVLATGTTAGGPALQTPLYGGLGLFPDANGVVTFVDYLSIAQLTTQATIQTIAGGQPLPAPDGTAALNAWFIQPNSIAFNRAGELYVGQPCIIQKISSYGLLSTIAGTGQCTAGSSSSGPALTTQLAQVNSVVVDSHDQVFFAGFESLYMVSREGVITEVAEMDPGSPSPKLAIDAKDRVYFLSVSGNVFGRVLPGGATEYVGVPGSNPDSPNSSLTGAGLAVDASDNVYVCCDQTVTDPIPTVFRYSPDLSFNLLNLIGLGLNYDYGIAVDSSSNIWQGQALLGLEKGTLSFGAACCSGTSYGDGGAAESAYISPSALAFRPNGDLYVLDADKGRIRRIHGSPPAVPPVISPGGIVNAASLAGGVIAPGELISIFGSNFGPSGLDVSVPQNNFVPAALSNVHVYFGGYLGRITARTQTQINVFVPYEVSTATSAQVIVDVDGVTSTPITVPVAPSAFGLSTVDASGSGQGAIFNQDGSYNSQSNPAARGTVVTLYGTGEGVTTPALPDGALVISTPYSTTQAPVVVKFGGHTAVIQYAGAAPFLPTGVFQIDATIPNSVTPGDMPVTVSIGGIGTTRTVTVAVQ